MRHRAFGPRSTYVINAATSRRGQEDLRPRISAATGRVKGSIAVQGLPMSIAATPGGSQVWVGNGYTGSISVISTATNTVTTTTISGGGQATALNSALTSIAFGS